MFSKIKRFFGLDPLELPVHKAIAQASVPVTAETVPVSETVSSVEAPAKKRKSAKADLSVTEIASKAKTVKKAPKKTAKKASASKKKTSKLLSPKDLATANKRPWVNVVSMDIDASSPGEGSFELDWNEYFVQDLREQGFAGASDELVVDQWFQTVCRNVAMQTWEQADADPEWRGRIQRKPLDGGRSEVS